MSNRLSEDDLTERLAAELREPAMLRLFLRFLFQDELPPALRTYESAEVQTQYRFSESSRREAQVGSRGRLDLMILLRQGAKTYAVGVEHKVWDGEKPSRLHNYGLLLSREGFAEQWLCEIVREQDYDLSREAHIHAVHRWREWASFLEAEIPPRNRNLQEAYHRLQEAMSQSGALVEGVVRRGRDPRLQIRPEADSILEALVEALTAEGVTAKVTGDRGLPTHIRAALPHWPGRLPGHWHDRLWIYIKEPTPGQFTFQMQVIFHNANFTDLDFSIRYFPAWAAHFNKLGCDITRGPAHGWDGHKRVYLQAPWRIDCRPKYFYAEESKPWTLTRSAPPHSLEELIADGVTRAKKLLQAFDAVATVKP